MYGRKKQTGQDGIKYSWKDTFGFNCDVQFFSNENQWNEPEPIRIVKHGFRPIESCRLQHGLNIIL